MFSLIIGYNMISILFCAIKHFTFLLRKGNVKFYVQHINFCAIYDHIEANSKVSFSLIMLCL